MPGSCRAARYNLKLTGRVKDGALRAEGGQKEKPGWLLPEGAIEADGTALFNARGLTASSALTLGNLRPGTFYSYVVVASFKGAKGTGKRRGGRECDLAFVKGRLTGARQVRCWSPWREVAELSAARWGGAWAGRAGSSRS